MKKQVLSLVMLPLLILSMLFIGQDSQAALPDRLSGFILLQVEEHGEAWYINPDNLQRYFLARPADAFSIMRELALGIKHSELETYLNSTFPERLSGKIMLDVEMNGEAYYIYPNDLKGYYLGRPADAFNIMRSLGLGITNTNLEQIAVNSDLTSLIDQRDIVKFSSSEDFQAYLEKVDHLYQDNYLPIGNVIERDMVGIPSIDDAIALESPAPTAGESAKQTADRVSETNVQVSGIDEPDFVKTDGQEIFFSSEEYFYPIFEDDIMPMQTIEPYPYVPSSQTRSINALPISQLKVDSSIDKFGRLLLSDDNLVVFEYDNISAHDVTDPTSPTAKWEIKLTDSTFVTARLYNNEIYLVTQTNINRDYPCPYRPIAVDDQAMIVACSDIYHPRQPMPLEVVYNIWRINPATGDVLGKNAITGSRYNTVVFMSNDNLYMTHYQPGDFVTFGLKFLIENESLFPKYLVDFFHEIDNFELTTWEKRDKLERALEGYLATLPPDEELKLSNELMNRFDTYAAENIRNYESTKVVRIGLSDLQIKATGDIPGKLLNQFSLGEENGHLFVATTIGENRFFGGSTDSANDVYSLDINLKVVDSIQDLGLTERIYAARFFNGKGYLVTFRQIDPFYVLDISNPANLQLKGELKIPGFSAYLHPISETQILGVGEEDWQVKLSLFDVSDPNNPTETAKYLLDEYHSDVLRDHRAFLQDSKHQIIFIPGSEAGYIFSYANDNLELLKVITGVTAKRALFINDYLYIVGNDGIIVLDENTWDQVGKLVY